MSETNIYIDTVKQDQQSIDAIQDGPSLESNSFLNVTLRYLGPWDLGTPGPLDSWTSSFFQHLLLHPLLPPLISSFYLFLLPLPPTILLWYGLGGGVEF